MTKHKYVGLDVNEVNEVNPGHRLTGWFRVHDCQLNPLRTGDTVSLYLSRIPEYSCLRSKY
jgi:hypothetical protein